MPLNREEPNFNYSLCRNRIAHDSASTMMIIRTFSWVADECPRTLLITDAKTIGSDEVIRKRFLGNRADGFNKKRQTR